MVFILPQAAPKESFGAQVGAGLGRGMSQGLERGIDYAQKLGIEELKAKSKQKMFGDLFGQGQQQPSDQQNDFLSLSPQQETVLALQDPTAFNAYKHLKESRAKDQEGIKQKENLKGTFEEMVKTLKGGNLGYTPSKFLTAEGRRDRQYFDSLNTQLESIGKDMVSKGVLSAPRFAFLLSNLPDSGKTDAANAGALEAWAKELSLDLPEDTLEELKSFYSDKPKKKSSKESSESSVMIGPDGKRYNIPKEKMQQAKDKGFINE